MSRVLLVTVLLLSNLSSRAFLIFVCVSKSVVCFALKSSFDRSCSDDKVVIYHTLINSYILTFVRVSCLWASQSLRRFERLQNRAHYLICGAKCPCSDFMSLEQRFEEAALYFMLKCDRYEPHSLHDCVPKRTMRNVYILPFCWAEKRLQTFFLFRLFFIAGCFDPASIIIFL